MGQKVGKNFEYQEITNKTPNYYYNLGVNFQYGKRNISPCTYKAVKYYKKAGDLPEALLKLGIIYYTSYCFMDYKKARKCFEKAGNLPEALLNLGDIYRLGKGVKRCFEKAKYYYEKAGNLPEAYIRIGILYANGQGVEQDYEEAIKYYKRAGNLPRAYYLLGKLYEKGTGVEQDYEEARKYYIKSWPNNHLSVLSLNHINKILSNK